VGSLASRELHRDRTLVGFDYRGRAVSSNVAALPRSGHQISWRPFKSLIAVWDGSTAAMAEPRPGDSERTLVLADRSHRRCKRHFTETGLHQPAILHGHRQLWAMVNELQPEQTIGADYLCLGAPDARLAA
jgi:hypothetical protein